LKKGRVKKKIINFLKSCHLDDIFPVNLAQIANIIGAKVYSTRFLPNSISGLLIPLKNKKYIIMINNKTECVHQRLTFAHELSHIILNHPLKSISPTLYFKTSSKSAMEITLKELGVYEKIKKGR